MRKRYIVVKVVSTYRGDVALVPCEGVKVYSHRPAAEKLAKKARRYLDNMHRLGSRIVVAGWEDEK
jgi:hypothetical protein